MKTIIKYISLLIIGGLMLPLTVADTCVYVKNEGIETSVQRPAHPAGDHSKPFSFLHDVLEKLLPAVSFLN